MRRCIAEGRVPPDEGTKRLALLRMLPPKQRESIWDVADQLYPTFAELLAKVQKLIQDEIDSKQGGAMDIDHVDDDEDWKNTGEVLTGKGANGEDTLFVLQRKGNMTRVRPKGKGKGKQRSDGGSPPVPKPTAGGKSSKWVKGGCARCGRGSQESRLVCGYESHDKRDMPAMHSRT